MTINHTMFELMDDTGSLYQAEQHLPLVVYFYPKDDTPGCTAEAAEFSELNNQFSQLGYQVVGISKDSIASHQRFKQKYNLSITLLSDPEKLVANQYKVVKPKKLYGKETTGIERSTFVLSKDGDIIKEYRKVKARGHAKTVVLDILSLIPH